LSGFTKSQRVGRRAFLKSAALAAAAMGGAWHAELAAQQVKRDPVPNSSGTDIPNFRTFENSCDCHHHIYDPRFPFTQPGAPMLAGARVMDYRLLQRRIGTTRNIVVTPAPYPAMFADNLVTLDAVGQFGTNSRGVAVVSPAITDAELMKLNEGGIRGIRFSLARLPKAAAAMEDIEPLAKRIVALGWHVQFNMTADQIVQAAETLNRIPTQMVFDHMGHMPEPEGINHPAYKLIRRLIDKNKTWVKLSVTYDSSKVGPPSYSDVNEVGKAYVKAAPERLVWGSNWPHPNEQTKPDDAVLIDLLATWAPREGTRRRILVDNPETLYGFFKS
jgi:predicted TIM-barrel fold metal-dependent hydrolase